MAAVSIVQRIGWVMNGDDDAPLVLGRSQLADKPALLFEIMPVQHAANIGIEPDDAHQRRIQRPFQASPKAAST